MTGLANNYQELQQQNSQENLSVLQQEIERLKQENQDYLKKLQTLEEKDRLLQLVLDNIPQLIFGKIKTLFFKDVTDYGQKQQGLEILVK